MCVIRKRVHIIRSPWFSPAARPSESCNNFDTVVCAEEREDSLELLTKKKLIEEITPGLLTGFVVGSFVWGTMNERSPVITLLTRRVFNSRGFV